MAIPKLLELISKVDAKRVEARFPSKAKFEEYERARLKFLFPLLQQVDDRRPLTHELLQRMERLSDIFRSIHSSLSPNTEIGSRAHVNEVFHWVKAGYVERSVFLAGVAKHRPVKQPYATQLQLLPAHACLLRFRQATKVFSYVADQLQSPERDEALQILVSSRASWLYQMNRFAQDAYDGSPSNAHPMANYLLALSCLLDAHEAEARGASAEPLIAIAHTLIDAISEPAPGVHYMTAQYHSMNHEEFRTFERLSRRHPRIAERLRVIDERVQQLMADQQVVRPREYSDIGHYVGLAGRAASILAVVATTAGIMGVGADDVGELINSVWSATVDMIPGMHPTDGPTVALHGGGPAFLDVPRLSVHGGGPA